MTSFLIDVGHFDGTRHKDVMCKHPEIYRNWVMDLDIPYPGVKVLTMFSSG